jgi:hypothetical protein
MEDFLTAPQSVEGKALKQRFEDAQTELDNLKKTSASKDEVQNLTNSMIKQGEAMLEFNKSEKEAIIEDFGVQYGKFLEKNQESISDILASGHGKIKFEPESYVNSDDALNIKNGLEARKAVGPITHANGTIVGTVPANNDARLQNINYRNDNRFINLATTVPTNSFSYPYTEAEPKEGGYGEVLEGGTKPEMDLDWITRYVTPFKIAAYEVLTEESAKDIPRLVSVARTQLRARHDLFKANQIYFGAGDGITAIEGATVAARTFSAGGMALGVVNPNFMDVVNACVTDIYTTHNFVDESSYVANGAMVNPVDFYLDLVSAKDSRGLPLYPQASLFNEVTIGGMKIAPWEKIPSGQIFVADMSKYNLTNWVPYSVSLGWMNAQFITNEFTMLGESRFHAFIKNHDLQAFIYDSIATIKSAIASV